MGINNKKTRARLYFQRSLYARLIDGKHVVQALLPIGNEEPKNGVHWGWVADCGSDLLTNDIELASIMGEDDADNMAKNLNKQTRAQKAVASAPLV